MKRKKSAHITRVVVGLIILLGIGGILLYKYRPTTQQKPSPHNSSVTQKSSIDTSTTTIIATGDFIAHDAINYAAKTSKGYAYDSFVEPMKQLMQKADIRFCNQSTLVGGEAFGVTGYPLFNAPTSFVDMMQNVGCNLINTASNHSSDKNQATIDANVAYWKSKQTLAVVGQNSSATQKQEVSTFEVKGVKYAFLAYTTYTNQKIPADYSVNMYNRDLVASQVQTAKTLGAKIIIVSMRWGTEYSQNVNAYQRSEAAYLAGLGVDIVLGHGPHVLEPVEWITSSNGKKTLVWYSLGNFLHAQLEAETIFNGVAVIKIDNKTNQISSVGFLPTYMHYEWTADQAAKQDLLARHGFSLVPIDQAAKLFEGTPLSVTTSIQVQEDRIKATLNTLAQVPIISSSDL